MAENQKAEERRPLAPVVTTAVLIAAVAALLAWGGVSAAGAMATPRIPAQPASTGVETPVADPSTPPDRDSDQTVEAPPEDTVYFIQRGDTLTSISAELGVSIDAIAEYNAVRDVNVISEGAVLRLPYIYIPPAAG